MEIIMKGLSVLLWLVMGGLLVVFLAANRVNIIGWAIQSHDNWMALSRRERRGYLLMALVIFGYFAAVTVSQDINGRRALERMGDVDAYWDGLYGGMSLEGAEAYSRYAEKMKEIDMSYHTLVANGDLDRLPSLRLWSPEEYLGRHPEFVCTPEEEASRDPRFQAQVTGVPYYGEE